MDNPDDVVRVFNQQKAAYQADRTASYESRLDRIATVEHLVRTHYKEIITAVQADFGTRGRDFALLGDIYSPLEQISHVRKHLRDWMKPVRKPSGLMRLTGQRDYIMHEPLGVVGVISPFNAPVTLALDPAIDALAAGNRVMVRFPEAMPRVSDLMASLIGKYFDESLMAAVTGDVEVAKLFSSLPWDKLAFTGGAETAKHIMTAAAKNLTPVLLELGGKSPVVVLDDADLPLVAEKTAKIRLMNGGQVCISGDYALVPAAKVDDFVSHVDAAATKVYPTIIDNPDFTSVVGEASYKRLSGYIDQARAAGARVHVVNPANEPVPDPVTRKFPLTMVIDPDESLDVANEEMFGPILAVVPYNTLDDAIAFINRREKPLALYVFGKDKTRIDQVLHRTSSGGVTVNDFLLHAGSHHMGFGGVGNSGMGRYKGGFVGFESFSNPKSVVQQGLVSRFSSRFLAPFADDRARRMILSRVGLTDE